MRYRRFTNDKYLVQDAALIAIETIACRYFVKERPLSVKDPEERRKCLEKVLQWWEKHKGSDEIQWAKEVLLSEKAVEGESRGLAIDSVYQRLGKDSYPVLVKAYEELPGTDAKADVAWLRPQILRRLLQNPTAAEKPLFASALQDSSLGMEVECAEGLWKLGDPSGLEAVVKDTEDRSLKWTKPNFREFQGNYDRQISFLLRSTRRDPAKQFTNAFEGGTRTLRAVQQFVLAHMAHGKRPPRRCPSCLTTHSC